MKKLLCTLACLSCISLATAQKTVTVGDEELRIRFDGRLTYDGAIYIPQTDITPLQYNNAPFRFSNGASLTQMRLGLHAMLGDKWSGRFDANYSDRKVAMTDAALFWHINRESKLIMGYFKDPVSMENNTASKYLSVATPMAVGMLTSGERYIGVTYARWGKQYWLAAGAYAGSLSSEYLPRANRGNDGYGMSARAAYVPIDNEYTTLHIGAYGRFRVPDGISGKLYIGTLPESTIDNRRFVTTSIDQVDNYWLGGLEAAFKFDKLFITGEYLFNHYNYKDERGGGYSFVSGWTVTGSYMLLGKQRKYLKGEAVFNPVGNLEHNGGLEVIGRLGSVNLNDTEEKFKGGQAFAAMLGLNWSPRANLLFGINYSYLDHDRDARGGNAILITNPSKVSSFDGVDFHTLQVRAQLIF
ncbi:MAG: porin [Porphyromonadaceae bacterium]|nr:porin [Porphyromonadaceae bacterium]